jgi:hypothetical protein
MGLGSGIRKKPIPDPGVKKAPDPQHWLRFIKGIEALLSRRSFCRAIRLVYSHSELEFLKMPWGLGTKEEEGYRTGPPGYIGWRNSFLGIDSGAPYTFKTRVQMVSLTNEGKDGQLVIHSGDWRFS